MILVWGAQKLAAVTSDVNTALARAHCLSRDLETALVGLCAVLAAPRPAPPPSCPPHSSSESEATAVNKTGLRCIFPFFHPCAARETLRGGTALPGKAGTTCQTFTPPCSNNKAQDKFHPLKKQANG